MNHIERRNAQLPYISVDTVMEEQKVCRRILQKLNFADRSDFDTLAEIVKELLGKSENAFINPPFYCDYSHLMFPYILQDIHCIPWREIPYMNMELR